MPFLYKQIAQKLSSLYFLKSQDIRDLLSRLNNVPEEALREIFEVVQAAHEKQNEYFSKINAIDPQFHKKLKGFIEGNMRKMLKRLS